MCHHWYWIAAIDWNENKSIHNASEFVCGSLHNRLFWSYTYRVDSLHKEGYLSCEHRSSESNKRNKKRNKKWNKRHMHTYTGTLLSLKEVSKRNSRNALFYHTCVGVNMRGVRLRNLGRGDRIEETRVAKHGLRCWSRFRSALITSPQTILSHKVWPLNFYPICIIVYW